MVIITIYNSYNQHLFAIFSDLISMQAFLATGVQIKSARTLLKWSQNDLAKKSNLAINSIRRIEKEDGIITGLDSTIRKLVSTLESNGIEFTGDFKNSIGVVLHFNHVTDNDRI